MPQNDLDHIASVCWQLERLIRARREKFEALGAVSNPDKMVPFHDAKQIILETEDLVRRITDCHDSFGATFGNVWTGEDICRVRQAFNSQNSGV